MERRQGKDTGAPMEWTNAVMQTYGLALFFLPFSPLQHGNQAVMPRGTVLEAAIDSDVLLPRAVIEADQPKPAEPHHGPASVTFYYPNFEDGAAVNVWCGEVKVAHLKRGGKFTLSLPPANTGSGLGIRRRVLLPHWTWKMEARNTSE